MCPLLEDRGRITESIRILVPKLSKIKMFGSCQNAQMLLLVNVFFA